MWTPPRRVRYGGRCWKDGARWLRPYMDLAATTNEAQQHTAATSGEVVLLMGVRDTVVIRLLPTHLKSNSGKQPAAAGRLLLRRDRR